MRAGDQISRKQDVIPGLLADVEGDTSAKVDRLPDACWSGGDQKPRVKIGRRGGSVEGFA